MNGESILGESDQFAPRKIVGRPASQRQVLWQLEQIRQFTDKHTQGKWILTKKALREILQREKNS